MSGSLLDQEAGADAYYGFPNGTLEALGQSETGNGQNLGSIGNLFQVLPSTAANPGYGLSSIDGNDPMSVGAYLSALWNGPASGNMASAMSLYQTGYANPSYTGNNAMSGYLSGLGATGQGASNTTPATATASTPAGTSTGTTGASDSLLSLSAIGSWFGSFATRGALILLAIILLIGAVYLFATRTQQVSNAT